MSKLLLRYIHEFKDRHGRTRRYFRRAGFQRIALPGAPGSDEFMESYQAALKGGVTATREVGASRTKPGTVDALVVRFYRSARFAGLAESTQATYRGELERFRQLHGSKRVALLGRDPIRRMIEAKISTPAAANNFLRRLRLLLDFAIEEGLRSDNPAIGVRGVRYSSDGHEPWMPEHIEAFRERHPLGTRARLAMELLYNTAQRRSDVVNMGPQHVRAGVLSLRQQKTRAHVDIPVLPELQAAIDATDVNHLTFLVTEMGQPFSAPGFGNWFRDMCGLAGLPKGYSAHGLRKAAATRLADAGCSDHEIAAWGGWKTLKEVQRYTATANRKKLAQSGAAKLIQGTSSGKPK